MRIRLWSWSGRADQLIIWHRQNTERHKNTDTFIERDTNHGNGADSPAGLIRQVVDLNVDFLPARKGQCGSNTSHIKPTPVVVSLLTRCRVNFTSPNVRVAATSGVTGDVKHRTRVTPDNTTPHYVCAGLSQAEEWRFHAAGIVANNSKQQNPQVGAEPGVCDSNSCGLCK